MEPYPVNLRLENRPALVVGAGAVALRKVRRLVEARARVQVVAPEVSEPLARLEGPGPGGGSLAIARRPYRQADLEGALLVFACTGDDALNAQIAAQARAAGALALSATSPEACDFTVPSQIRRGELQITISTGGASPALSKHLRGRLEDIFPEGFGDYLDLLARVRERQLGRGQSSPENAEKFRALVESGLETAVLSGDWEEAERILEETLGEEFGLKELGWGK